MTNFEIFNQSVRNIINQGGFSTNNKVCVYRASNGRKCVAGHFIPDEKYVPGMEFQVIIDYDRVIPNIFTGIFEDIDVEFLGNLQVIHDNCTHFSDSEFFREWISEMIQFGIRNQFDLSVFQEYLSHEVVGGIITSALLYIH